MVIFSFIFFVFFVVKAKQKTYFPSRKPWAALGAAATIRDFEQVYNETRTYFKHAHGNFTIETSSSIRCDRSSDIAAAGRQPAAVLPLAAINADHLKRETKKADLTTDSGIVFQAKSPNPGWFGSPSRREAAALKS